MRRSLPLVTTLAVEVGTVVLLYRFIKEPGFAIPIALGCAAWMLSSTLLYLFASVARVPAAISAVGRVTLPSVRRRVDRALAASILTGAVLVGGAPALAAAPLASEPTAEPSVVVSESDPASDSPATPAAEPTPELPVRSGRVGDPEALVEISTVAEPALEEPPDTTATTEPESASESTPDDAAPDSAPDPTPSSTSRPDRLAGPASPPAPTAPTKTPTAVPAGTVGTYTVVAGDNFWEIAARHLAAETGRERGALSTNDIVGYWVRVCNANRDRIRSGDVNLIDPGEVVELPPV